MPAGRSVPDFVTAWVNGKGLPIITLPQAAGVEERVLRGLPTLVVIDAVMRLVPGVLGHEESNRDDSFSGEDRLLEHEQYTRPREYRGHEVPEILLSGDHPRHRALV